MEWLDTICCKNALIGRSRIALCQSFPRKSGHEDKQKARIVYNTTLEGEK